MGEPRKGEPVVKEPLIDEGDVTYPGEPVDGGVVGAGATPVNLASGADKDSDGVLARGQFNLEPLGRGVGARSGTDSGQNGGAIWTTFG